VSESAGPVSVPVPAVPTLNRGRLEMIARDASREFLVELAALFVKDVEERIGFLAAIVGSRDVTGTADAAHRVQSAATSLGVLRLRSLAAMLEKHAEGEDWRRVELALERIQREFSHVKNVLEELRQQK
jgi:HPt (histidine-containing phosphotransfer) domain-containing protein